MTTTKRAVKKNATWAKWFRPKSKFGQKIPTELTKCGRRLFHIEKYNSIDIFGDLSISGDRYQVSEIRIVDGHLERRSLRRSFTERLAAESWAEGTAC
jgi:hypothetical protein